MDRNHHDSATDGHDLIQTKIMSSKNQIPWKSSHHPHSPAHSVTSVCILSTLVCLVLPKSQWVTRGGAKDTKGARQPDHNHPSISMPREWADDTAHAWHESVKQSCDSSGIQKLSRIIFNAHIIILTILTIMIVMVGWWLSSGSVFPCWESFTTWPSCL